MRKLLFVVVSLALMLLIAEAVSWRGKALPQVVTTEPPLTTESAILALSTKAVAIESVSSEAVAPPSRSSVVAFPGAEGFGANAVGGRGGEVIEVTNLDNTGPGSLRACVRAEGPRTCVFRVAGTIELSSTLEIANPYITIAGQTAPGDGITLKIANPNRNTDILKISTHDVIIRYIRSRPGTKGDNARALSINAGRQVEDRANLAYNIIIDHSSFSWAGDEVIIAWDKTHHVTLQWNIIAESLPPGLKGPNLGHYGGGFYSVHHNLIAHHAYRTPNVSASGGPTDLVNNVIYNFRRYGSRVLLGARVNIVNNYIKAGPDTMAGVYVVRDDLDVRDPDSDRPLPNPDSRGFYIAGNVIEDPFVQEKGTARILDIVPPESLDADIKQAPYDTPSITTTSAEDAYADVLTEAGAIHGLNCDGTWFYRPDAVDERIIVSVLNNRSSHNTENIQLGYITDPSEVGGWPALDPGTPCPDSDHDGMPDEWEYIRGFNPHRNDSAIVMSDGYTRLEHYLNGIVEEQQPAR